MNRSKLLVGLALVGAGIVLVGGSADWWDAGEVLATWWPVVVIAAGLLAIGGRPPAVLAGGIVAVAGAGILLVTTDVIDLSAGAIWGTGLILLGLWFTVGRMGARHEHTDDTIDVTCLFSGREVVSQARPFRGGAITGIFGGVELDLTGATLDGRATLDAVGIFGGAQVTVPPGWRVEMNGPAIFGGYDNGAARQSLGPDAPVLSVRVLALFGAVEVKLGLPQEGPDGPADLPRSVELPEDAVR